MVKQKHYLEVAAMLAGELGHTYIGTEHLLLAILTETNPTFAPTIETAIIEMTGQGTPYEISTDHATHRVKKALHENKTVEDFLITMCGDTHCTAGMIISKLHLTFSDLMANTDKVSEVSDKIKERDLMVFYREKDKEFSTLSQFARNLNLEYLKGNIADVFGRENEIENIKKIMLRRNKTNVLLLGKAGCGKTAIVEGLAIDIVKSKINSQTSLFSNFVIYDLSINSLVSGSKYRGDFEEKVERILKEIEDKDDIIIFIDEIHQINSAGCCGEQAISLGQILKPALSRNLIKCIGATTIDESKYIKEDKALARRFSDMTVSEFSKEKQISIAKLILTDYGKYHNINIDNVDIDNVMNIIKHLMTNTVFPDNIINVIDETMASAKYDGKMSIDMGDIKKTISRITNLLIV